MLSGCYRKRVGSRSVVGDANTVVFFRPGEPFTVEHPFGDENLGLTIRLDERRLEQAIEESRGALMRRSSCGADCTHSMTSSTLHLRLRRLLRDLESAIPVGSFEIEERVARIVRNTLVGGGTLERPDRMERHVESAREYLDEHFACRVTLDDLSRATGISPGRVCRVFSDRMGIPVHRYLTRLRLREALTRVSEGATDLTRLALNMGFSSHSHFSAGFRREFDATPRELRSRGVEIQSSKFKVQRTDLSELAHSPKGATRR